MIRATSLSGVANHYISISPGPNSSPALDDGATLGLGSTTTEVDLDQFLNTFPTPVRRALGQFVRGNAEQFSDRGKEANATFKYFGPALNRTTAFVSELNADQNLLERFVVSSSQALHRGRPARQRALQRDLQRQHRLRRDRRPERSARPDAAPAAAVHAPEPTPPSSTCARRSTTSTRWSKRRSRRPRTWRRSWPNCGRCSPKRCRSSRTSASASAAKASPTTPPKRSASCRPCRSAPRRPSRTPNRRSTTSSRPLNFARAYTPDIFNGFGRLGQITGYYDGNGHYARAQLALNLFKRNSSSGELEPIAAERTVRRLRRLRRRAAPLPRRRHPVGARRLQPLHRTALRRLRREPIVRLRPGRRATRTMRKWLLAAGLVAAVVVVVLLASGGGGGSSGYVVRGIFDSGGFMVTGEEVRVAGATVGEIESVDVTMPGEIDSYEDGKPQAVPGKAVIAMKIVDPGFQDFRSDASCLIRPQSLIGEKFVDCRPTLPRAPGSKPAPRAEADPRRRAGRRPVPAAAREQQHQRRPRPDQQHQPADLRAALPADPQRTRRRPRRPRRGHRGGRQARQPGAARRRPPLRHPHRPARPAGAARRRLRADPRAARARARQRRRLLLQRRRRGAGQHRKGRRRWKRRCSKLPAFLRELRQTMGSFEYFSDAGTPVVESLGKAAPSLTQATRALTPFSAASTVSLKSLGASGEVAGPKIRAADPVVKKIRDLARSGAGPTTELAELPGQHQEDRGLRRPRRPDLQQRRVDQRIRSVRPLRSQPHRADQLHRLRDRADQRLLGELQRPRLQRTRVDLRCARAVPARCRKNSADRRAAPRPTPAPAPRVARPAAADPTGPEPRRRRRARRQGEARRPAACPPRLPPGTMRNRSGIQGVASSPVIVGAVTVLVVIVAVFLAYNANNGLPFVSTYDLKARVPNANALVKGNEVRIGGSRVGVVREVKPIQFGNGAVAAELDLKLDKSAEPIPADSTMIIRPKSPLGLKYLQIVPGDSAEGLAAGETIPLTAARPEPVDIDQFFSMFDEKTRKAIQRNNAGFGNAFAGRGPQINAAFGALRSLAEHGQPVLRTLVAPGTDFGGFWEALEDLSATVAPGRRDAGEHVRRPRPHLRRLRPRLAAVHPGNDRKRPADARRGHRRPAGAAPLLPRHRPLLHRAASRAPRRWARPRRRSTPPCAPASRRSTARRSLFAQLTPTAEALLDFQAEAGVFNGLDLLDRHQRSARPGDRVHRARRRPPATTSASLFRNLADCFQRSERQRQLAERDRRSRRRAARTPSRHRPRPPPTAPMPPTTSTSTPIPRTGQDGVCEAGNERYTPGRDRDRPRSQPVGHDARRRRTKADGTPA